jgi:hypothetical protein
MINWKSYINLKKMSNLAIILTESQKKSLYFFKNYSMRQLKESMMGLDSRNNLSEEEGEIMNEALELHRIMNKLLKDKS